MGSHCFGFLCVKNTEKWCAHCIIDEWVLEAKTFGLSFNEGLLFPKLDAQGKIKLGLRWGNCGQSKKRKKPGTNNVSCLYEEPKDC